MHKQLARQLKRLRLEKDGEIHIDADVWQTFLESISESYGQADASLAMVERSLKLVSSELTQRNRELRSHVTTLQKNQEVINFQANHDALTHLPNRVLFEDRLEHALKVAEQNNNLVAVLFIDLDHFKKINDTCGHQKGDELLCEIAQRLTLCLREYDTLARLGGDEFVVLLENVKSFSTATNIGRRILDELSKPCFLDTHSFHISASVGISIYPRDDSDSRELIRKADMAMYHAKEKGRNNLQFFSQPLEKLALHHIQMESRIRRAIEQSEFSLVYQPKVSTPDFKIVGFEALIRWQEDNRAPVSPAEFIPIAEKAGLINAIGDWVLHEACSQIQKWLKTGYEDFSISVNISTREILDISLAKKLESLLQKYQIPPSMLQIEITETALMEDISAAKKTLNSIRDLGLSVSLDDFGTGYSSLSYLQSLPIDYLKIDKAFIRNINENDESVAIALSIISLGHNLNMKVIAEGAEDQGAVDLLTKNHCDLIQGYYFYKPMPATEAEKHLLASNNNKDAV